MTVYGTTRIPLRPDKWETCQQCGGIGSVKDVSTSPPTFTKCGNPDCDGGYIKSKLIRASLTAIQDAQNKREGY